MTGGPLGAHDSAPRTLGALLCDTAQLEASARRTLRALEEGRHPPLDELRAALGDDLDIAAPLGAARIALGAGPPDVAHLAAALDSAYRALASPRIVRATITPDRVSGARDGGPIRVREDASLVLLVLSDNRTDATVEFSAESHGEGFGGFVEAHRTGSSLLDLGAMPPGRYLVPLLIVAGGRPTTVDLPIECAAHA
jgi:hypothetical protein